MKIRITDERLAQHYGLNTANTYTVVRPANDETLNSMWSAHPDDPYKDADGDYWIDASSGGRFGFACLAPHRIEVVE